MTQHKHTPEEMEIPLTKGAMALIDAEDYDLVKRYKWHLSGAGGYANHAYRKDGKSYRIIMHRLIMNAPKGMEVDHINGNRLDNRRSNLRVCTKAQNYKNRKRSSHSKQPFKGARKRKNRWEATISVDGKNIHLGTFLTPEDAAAAYDKAAKIHHKEFASVNGVQGHGISQRDLLSEAVDALKTYGLTPRQLAEKIDRLTKERDEARLTAERLLDENTNLLNGLKAGNAHVDVLFVRGKLSWEDKTDE